MVKIYNILYIIIEKFNLSDLFNCIQTILIITKETKYNYI